MTDEVLAIRREIVQLRQMEGGRIGTNARNICGLPPTFVAIEALRPRAGKVLNYER